MPRSKVAILGMVIPPLIGNPYNGYINPYYWVDDHPLLYGNNGSFDPGTYLRVSRIYAIYVPCAYISEGIPLYFRIFHQSGVNQRQLQKELKGYLKSLQNRE